MAPAFNILFTIFSGVLISVDQLPPGSGWLAIIGYNRWTFEAFALNEFRDRDYACGRADAASCMRSGNQVLSLYGYSEGSIGRAIGYLFAIALVIHVLAFLNLWRASARYLNMEEDKAQAPAATAAAAAIPALPSAEEEQSALEEVAARGAGATHMAPVPPVDLAWRGVEMVVPVKGKGDKAVLDRVSGDVKAGTLTAIMGPSGMSSCVCVSNCSIASGGMGINPSRAPSDPTDDPPPQPTQNIPTIQGPASRLCSMSWRAACSTSRAGASGASC